MTIELSLDTQIKSAITRTLEKIQIIIDAPTFDSLYDLAFLCDDLATLAKQGEVYKQQVLSGLKEEWLTNYSLILALKNLLESKD